MYTLSQHDLPYSYCGSRLDRYLTLFASLVPTALMPRKPMRDETLTDIDDRWQDAFASVGLERPADEVEILVYRVVFTATNKTICTKSVTSASPNCEPEEVISNLLTPWPDLLAPGADTWRLAMVHPSRKQAREPELCQPTYIIIPASLPVLRRRPQCLLEVVWGHRSWIAAIAMPRWVNAYSCYALLRGLGGPVLEHSD